MSIFNIGIRDDSKPQKVKIRKNGLERLTTTARPLECALHPQAWRDSSPRLNYTLALKTILTGIRNVFLESQNPNEQMTLKFEYILIRTFKRMTVYLLSMPSVSDKGLVD